MNLTPCSKLKRDRARFQTQNRRNRNLIPDSLKIIFGHKRRDSNGTVAVGQITAGNKLRKCFKKSHMDTSILSQLVGLGFLRPTGGSYALTSKGSKAINDSLPLPMNAISATSNLPLAISDL